MSRQHRRRSWSNQQLDDILRALPFPTPPLASYVYSSRDRFHPCCHKDKPVEVKPCSATKERSLRICTPLLYSFIHEATPGNRLGSLVACCEQTAKKTPGICNFGLTSGNVEDERARHSAGQVYTGRGTSSRGLHAMSGPPSQCNECGILLRIHTHKQQARL